MNEIFKKDVTIKILSVLSAVVLWIYVYNVDVNPYTSRNMIVPLKAVNESALIDKDIKLESKLPESVVVKANGRKKALDELKENDIKAVVDFTRVKSVQDKNIPIDITCNKKGVTIEDLSTGYSVDLTLSRVKSSSFPIEIIPNITFKQGYKKLKITTVPDACVLEGDEAIVDSVDVVRAELDVKNIDRDITKRVECKIFNMEGKDISRYFPNIITVDVKIEVAKEVPITLVVTGKPAPDYIEGTKSISPVTALITGNPEILEKVNDLKTEPVSIENLKQNLDTTGVIKLPEGVKLAAGEKEIAVSIVIEHLETRNYTILKDDIKIINKSAEYNYNIINESVTLSIKGLERDLSGLHTEAMNLTLNMRELSEGTHQVPLNIVLPSAVKLLENVNVDVEVAKVVTEETTTPTSSE